MLAEVWEPLSYTLKQVGTNRLHDAFSWKTEVLLVDIWLVNMNTSLSLPFIQGVSAVLEGIIDKY